MSANRGLLTIERRLPGESLEESDLGDDSPTVYLFSLQNSAQIAPVTPPNVSLSAAYQDGITRVPGTDPVSTSPNDYNISGTTGFNTNTFSLVGGWTSAASLLVEAVPYNLNVGATTLGVFVDGAYYTTLHYNGALGVKDTQTLSLPNDGIPHFVEIEEQASLTNITGAITFPQPTAPTNRVAIMGDSITARISASEASLAYATILRHSMPAGWRTAIWGRSGKTLNGQSGVAPQFAQRLDGTVRNVAVIYLMINDYLGGVSLSSFGATADLLIAGLNAQGIPGLKILLVTSPQTTAASGGGGTIAQYRSQFTSRVGSNVYCMDNTNLFPSGGSGYLIGDSIHFSDLGHAYMAAAMKSAILAIP